MKTIDRSTAILQTAFLVYILGATISFLVAGCYLIVHEHLGCGIMCLIFSVIPIHVKNGGKDEETED